MAISDYIPSCIAGSRCHMFLGGKIAIKLAKSHTVPLKQLWKLLEFYFSPRPDVI